MKFKKKAKPRKFTVGNLRKFELTDCGSVFLDPDEQLTFVLPSGSEYDVVRKSWGFYAMPSLNGRLQKYGLRTVLVRSTITGKYFILLVENGKENEFEVYLTQEACVVIVWLDSTANCDALREVVEK